MSTFAWRRRPTRHFGEQYIPFVEIALQSTGNRWRTFSVQVDTGAVISLLPRSVGELLGIDVASGDPVDLAGVGESASRYFVHTLSARIEPWPEFKLRVAFCEREDVPSLFGRLDVLDRFQIDLDVSLEETRITRPWLSENERLIWRHFMEVESTILRKWSEHPLPGRIDEAARRFINQADRLLAAAAGLTKLHRGSALPMVIRSLFDLAVQFEYLMRNPVPCAALYLDFEFVTKHHSTEAWTRLPGPLGNFLRESAARARSEKRNLAEYTRVRSAYLTRKGRIRPHWYPGTLKELATEVARGDEYDAIFGLYSAWTHGDPWTADLGDIAVGGLLHVLGCWARLMIQIADAKKIILTGEAYESLVTVAKGIDYE